MEKIKININIYKNFFILLSEKLKLNKILIIIFSIILMFPLYRTGINVYDELQLRLCKFLGIKSFLKYHYEAVLQHQGRMPIPLVLNNYLNFFSTNQKIYKLVEIFIIISNVVLFGYLLYKVTKNKKLSFLSMIIFIAFLPMGWEPVPPNAYTGMYGISISVFLVSLIYYQSYLETENKKFLIISGITYLYSLLTYELFLFYFLLYLVMALKKDNSRLKIVYVNLKYIIIITLSYLFLYFVLRLCYPSAYDGNKLALISLKRTLNQIFFMFRSSFPGYYLFNAKYRFLFRVSNEFSQESELFINVRIILYMILGVYFINKILKLNTKKIEIKKNIFIIIIILFLMILTLSVRVLSKTNQENPIVGPDLFIGFTNTYFTYFLAVFIISSIVSTFNNKIFKFLAMITFVIFSTSTQIMNEVISLKQEKEYKKLTDAERIFETNEIINWNEKKIFSEDLYKMGLAIGLHKNYWTEITKIKKLNIEVSNKLDNQNGIIISRNIGKREIFLLGTIDSITQDQQILTKNISIFSLNNLESKKVYFKNENNEYNYIELKNGIKDKKFYKYNINFDKTIFTNSIDIVN